jgi:hypothetical protein
MYKTKSLLTILCLADAMSVVMEMVHLRVMIDVGRGEQPSKFSTFTYRGTSHQQSAE